ncbi:MAG TPA: nicotinate phosphoribosyltransferase [Acidimicrobiales bacterium]|nr:nicotinate phosphoribosyltransferase [Acidimicrobiales bacterium]HJM28456.1 nicotinate phosphoribosyltransferase [Acidimicrobiales bacterium]HJM96969.1 nicotinate phosphoribosyltransferase [Acidimicrobiales bacterium]
MDNEFLKSQVLHTDHYEFTMLDALVKAGHADKKSAFEVFAREIPLGRPYGVYAGNGRLLQTLQNLKFNKEHLAYLERQKIISSPTKNWLTGFQFSGDITGYREGEIYFPLSPVITVESRLGEALILETLILSITNFDSAVASAASRIVGAAAGRYVMEAGSRRITPEAGVHAARAAYIGGVDVTSNLEAGRRWGIPTAGTASHAFTLAFESEIEAFQTQSEHLGEDSIFLVDTYDIEKGIRNAVNSTNANLRGIRIDSGDLATEAQIARNLLDDLGAHQAEIMVSGDLDEYRIADLVNAPIDAFEAGHRLVTGSGAGSAGFVYKLVAIEDSSPEKTMRIVAKTSKGKISKGGRKLAKRKRDLAGAAIEESLFVKSHKNIEVPSGNYRDLQYQLVEGGVVKEDLSLEDARTHLTKVLSEIPEEIRLCVNGDPAVPTVIYENKETDG